ncbi:tetratricopeptide repeat protein [Nocardia sp. NPDC057440]|uniref:tetratricopeptide repeat protein n=1 Tax=Nocardia sp. NPDC057440 TaxID=3346134 RepID=UPI003671B1A4
MDATEIRSALAHSCSLPEGRGRAQRLETLAAAAKAGPDRALEGAVLLELAKAYAQGGEWDLAPVAYARLLRIHDDFPAELGAIAPSVHWYLKWMTSGLIGNPAVPLPTTYRWLDELENRYRQQGYSARPVFALRSDLARELGEHEQAARLLDAAMAAPRDGMSDCEACERSGWGVDCARAGDDEGALAQWRPVLDGERSCAEQPQRVLAHALLPLVRTGRTVQARNAHLTGYPLVRHSPDLRHAVAEHIEFCALTGNEARGLDILAAHAAWLTDQGSDAAARLSFTTGVSVLLRRLEALGLGDLCLGVGTVYSVRANLDIEIGALSDRFDARNDSTVVSARVATRLAQQPLLERLPLGLRHTLPRPARPQRAVTATERVAAAAEREAEALWLAGLAAARLIDRPAVAERHLRRALSIGATVLPAEHLARLSSQLVMVLSGQPGRESELADAALDAVARWEGISDADAVHLTFVAARAFHRAGRHGEAAALFEQPIAAGKVPYPAAEMAVLRRQYAESLRRLGRFRAAARQFVEAARLVHDDPGRIELQADLVWAAATALENCDEDDQALAAYLHAAQLWGELGRVGPRARCLRSAAWVQIWSRSGESDERPWLATMGGLLAELEQRAGAAPSAEVTSELAHTHSQLADMRREVGDTGAPDS